VEQSVFCEYAGKNYKANLKLTDSVGGELNYSIEISVTHLNLKNPT
jgi:hypothetical protein